MRLDRDYPQRKKREKRNAMHSGGRAEKKKHKRCVLVRSSKRKATSFSLLFSFYSGCNTERFNDSWRWLSRREKERKRNASHSGGRAEKKKKHKRCVLVRSSKRKATSFSLLFSFYSGRSTERFNDSWRWLSRREKREKEECFAFRWSRRKKEETQTLCL